MPAWAAYAGINIRPKKGIFKRPSPLWGNSAGKLPEIWRFDRMPPAAANDDAFGCDLAVANQMLADDVDIIEPAFPDRDQRGVADAARLQAAKFRAPQRHRRIDRRRRDHVSQRHAHA